ncbi:MAG: hypothetical protein ACFE95_17195 [Candidatus Hodarchaeota archaeon]
MNTKILCTVVLFLISIMIFLPSKTSTAKVIWEENFESGLENWEVSGFNVTDFTPLPGNISDTNGILRITGDDTQETIAEHPSTQATGTWSFDLDVTPTKRNHFYVAFFGENSKNLSESIPFEYGVMPVTASFGMWDSEFVFYRRMKGSSSITSLGRYSPSQILGWHHFDITRTTEGVFNIFINGSHRNSFQDTIYMTTEVFRISGGPGPGIDNIVVQDDFVFTTTTSETDISFEFLALSLLLLGLFKRKRNKIGT